MNTENRHHDFELDFATASPHTGSVRMDGMELRGVTKMSVSIEAGDVITVTLTFLPQSLRAKVNGATVEASIAQLLAETTGIGDQFRQYAAVQPKTAA